MSLLTSALSLLASPNKITITSYKDDGFSTEVDKGKFLFDGSSIKLDYTNVYRHPGGIYAWKGAGFPVERGE